MPGWWGSSAVMTSGLLVFEITSHIVHIVPLYSVFSFFIVLWIVSRHNFGDMFDLCRWLKMLWKNKTKSIYSYGWASKIHLQVTAENAVTSAEGAHKIVLLSTVFIKLYFSFLKAPSADFEEGTTCFFFLFCSLRPRHFLWWDRDPQSEKQCCVTLNVSEWLPCLCPGAAEMHPSFNRSVTPWDLVDEK